MNVVGDRFQRSLLLKRVCLDSRVHLPLSKLAKRLTVHRYLGRLQLVQMEL